MTHQMIDDLAWRHTIKKYDTTRKVSEADLQTLFEAIRLSASSINSQPWRLLVIESESARQRLHDTFEHKFQFNQAHAFEASQIILFAHNPRYTREDYAEVVDQGIVDGRTKEEEREQAFMPFMFVEMVTGKDGDTTPWTKHQVYLAFGNALHALARLRIGSTPLEGLDTELINQAFAAELGNYHCELALAIGYSHADGDYNAKLPKSRLPLEKILNRI